EPAFADGREPESPKADPMESLSPPEEGNQLDSSQDREISEPETAAPKALPASFSGIVDLVGEVSVTKQSILKADIRLIEFAPPRIVYEAVRPIAPGDLKQIADILRQETGESWILEEGSGTAQPSMDEQKQLADEAERQKILEMPMVKAAFDAFPDAELLETGGEPDHISDETSQPHQTRSSLA
ncbi:MAG: hypothetical protein AAF067_10475, partial [Pseudomonadota bacterium]